MTKKLTKKSLHYVLNLTSYEVNAFRPQASPLSSQQPIPTNNHFPSPPAQLPESPPSPIQSPQIPPNLKPAKPDAWESTDHDAKPFWNRVLNYLGSFSGMAFSKQVVFVLILTMHAKSQSWTNTRQDWLVNNPARLPPTIPELLEDFIQEFGDWNAAISAQHWIDTMFQG